MRQTDFPKEPAPMNKQHQSYANGTMWRQGWKRQRIPLRLRAAENFLIYNASSVQHRRELLAALFINFIGHNNQICMLKQWREKEMTSSHAYAAVAASKPNCTTKTTHRDERTRYTIFGRCFDANTADAACLYAFCCNIFIIHFWPDEFTEFKCIKIYLWRAVPHEQRFCWKLVEIHHHLAIHKRTHNGCERRAKIRRSFINFWLLLFLLCIYSQEDTKYEILLSHK